MDRRFSRRSSSETMSLRQKIADKRNPSSNENVPDLTDFINDMFFGTVKVEKKEYNFTGTIDNRHQERAEEKFFDSSVRSGTGSGSVKACSTRKGTPRFVNDYCRGEEDSFDSSTRSNRSVTVGREARYSRVGQRFMEEDEDFDSSTRSVSSKLTQEWLKEAKRMVANSSPGRGGCDSPGRLVGSPRFATSQGRLSVSSNTDKRDPFSRSARRYRAVDGFSEEILTKSAKHNRTKSESTLDHSSPELSPASAVHKWFSNILKPPNSQVSIPSSPTSASANPTTLSPKANRTTLALPPRQSTLRKSRFQNASQSPIPSPNNQLPSKRNFKSPATNTLRSSNTAQTVLDDLIISPPKNLVESSASPTCSVPKDKILSPPRKLVESVHRRSISASTCSMDKIYQKDKEDCGRLKENNVEGKELNGFLRDQRQKIEKILNKEIDVKAKIVLSGPSNSTSSMVAAICYARLLENRMRANKEGDERDRNNIGVVVPVMNIPRANMWKQQQAAWLFHHVGLDVKALFFFDEVDLETLTESRQVIIQVAGQDVLRTNGEVVSECTVLTDNYCEEAYDLLQIPILKKLLLAGILLDTRNSKLSAKVSMTRDAEAVQLLTVGTAPNYINTLFDQLMQDHKDNKNFNEALQQSYGEPPSESNHNEEPLDQQVAEKSSNRQSKSDKNSSDTKNSKCSKASSNTGKCTPSPKEVPAPTPPKAVGPPRPKNRFFLAKWFGLGSK